MIANSDMRLGNLSFRPHRTFNLVPACDMLPIVYAPLPGGEVPSRAFDPALPLAAQRKARIVAGRAAAASWQRAAGDARITAPFRDMCATSGRRVLDLAEKV